MGQISCIAVLLGVLVVSAVSAEDVPTASPIEAKLVVPDRKILPGVPFDMWIELKNPSRANHTVGLVTRILVRPDDRATFEIAPADSPIALTRSVNERERPQQYVTLAAGESKTLTFPIRNGLQGALLFDDHRLSQPGTYRLAIRLEDPGASRGGKGSVTTDEVVVERIHPQNEDAVVWLRMQELADGKWTTPSGTITGPDYDDMIKRSVVWDEILSYFPGSNYVPYAVLATASRDAADLKRLVNAIDRFPESPVAELLHGTLWRLAGTACGPRESAWQRACDKAWAKVNQSRRPTTRVAILGPHDVPAPCPPSQDCDQ